MSLTSHIKNPTSPVRVWLEERFPSVGEALTGLRAAMPADLDARTIRPAAGVTHSTVGMAMDYRIRYHLAVTPSDELVATHGAKSLVEQHLNEHDMYNRALWRGPEVGGFRVSGISSLKDPDLAHLSPGAFFTLLDSLLDDIRPVGRSLDAESEERLDRACAVLALYEEVYRTGRIWPTSPLASVPMEASADQVLAIIPRPWTEDIAAVCARLFAEVPLIGPAILNPTFALSRGVGGADADLVLNGCLLDIKSTVNTRLDRIWLLQLLGYTLLDSDDACHIDSVGILFARQAVMTQWPLGPLLDAAAGTDRPPLSAMRADFAEFLSTLARPMGPMRIVVMAPMVPNPSTQADRAPKPSSNVGPHPATLDTIGLEDAAAVTGRSRSAIRRAIADGRLAAIPPRTNHPAGNGSGFRMSRKEVEALFPPTPEARARVHLCGSECDGPQHVSYVAAQLADLDSAEDFLRQIYHLGALVAEDCRPSEASTDGLLRMTLFYVRRVVSVPPDYPWQSWRVVWRDQGSATV